jgi:hypothetical protein
MFHSELNLKASGLGPNPSARNSEASTITDETRWDEFFMARSTTTINENGTVGDMLCRGVWSRGLRLYWCLRARG